MSESALSQLKKGVIKLKVNDLRELYQLYMPFIEGCGIFYPTSNEYKMGQDVFVFLSMPEEVGKFAISGRVVWQNPKIKSGRRVPGIGIQLIGREVTKIREAIEHGLGKMLTTGLPTAAL